MSDMMNELYYMLEERIGQECAKDEEVKALMERKSAVVDEIVRRVGREGEDLWDGLTVLGAELEEIYRRALFQAALCLGVEAARPGLGESNR